NAPVPNADKFVELCYAAAEILLLRSYRGAFYEFTGTHWRELYDEALEHQLYKFLAAAFVPDRDGNLVPFNPTKSKVNEIMHALRPALLIGRRVEMPSWLGKANAGRSARNLVACRNGILNLDTRELLPHDPNFFTANCLPLDYDPQAPKPKQWLRFLAQLWPEYEDEER